MKVFSGIVEVGYSDSLADAAGKSGTYAAIAGEVDAESTVEAPPTTNNTTVGITYGGGTLNANQMFFDHTTKSTVKGFMDTDGVETKKFWTFTLEDGRLLHTNKAIAPMVEEMIDSDAREGATPWGMNLERYSNSALLTEIPAP